MSYILEAIKKADQKRKLGSVPDVHTVHEGPPPIAKRLVWPYVLAAALFVNSALIFWWIQPWSAKAPPNRSASRQVVAKHIAEAPAAPSKTPDNGQTAKVEIPAAKLAVLPEVASQAATSAEGQIPPDGDESVPPKIEVIPVADKLPAETVAAESANDEPAGTADSGIEDGEKVAASPLESLDSMADHPQIIERIGGQPLPDTDYGEIDLKTEQKRQQEKEKLAKIPYLHRLPADFQKDIPEIHISFHSYYYKPAKRLVSINGRIFREGEELKKGLKLEEITPGGIVLSYKDVSFRIKI